MSSHCWGDEDFDWKALNDAMSLIHKIGKLGFLSIWMKEKYGTIRYEFTCFWGFKPIITPYQQFIFHLAVTIAAYRYKHIASEVVEDLLSNYINERTGKGYVPWYWKPIIKENPWSTI